ncbi:DUF1828 domain-containing protein [Staphylococcus xylosus]|uniref:DUF1828 domain-containing protein n=2 Tax=Staphylococcus TaxID=1279 RepID=UPI002DB9E7F7|nr:DUF1828 domain-containing protein [Staphylococcus xylosus]MEB8060592.1 DUF1828 domain-containing protein [Staphylococcus xylosus]
MEIIEKKMDEYFKWLKEKYKYKKLDDSMEITTPFKNHLNDYIRIYMDVNTNNKIRLSDDGLTLNELDMYGIDVKTKTRQMIITTTLNQFNLKLVNDEIVTDAAFENFAQAKHNILQGILKVYDLTMTIKTNISNLFYEEVYDFLYEEEIGGSDKVSVAGESGINYTIDYILPPSKSKSEILINFANNLDFNKITSNSFTYRDVKNNRPNRNRLQPKMKVIANDEENTIPNKVLQAAEYEGIDILPWSDKQKILNSLKR